ncbi:MAG: alpha/beta hydrolase family protein, partial [Telluria sp.]
MILASVRARTMFAFVLGLSLATGAAAQAPLPPLEQFFAAPQLDRAQLSPKGLHVAAIASTPGARDTLVVIDLQTNKLSRVAGYDNADILDFSWVNEDRLLFNVTDKKVGPGKQEEAYGLFAVNRDGSALRQLAERRGEANAIESHIKTRRLPWHTFILPQRGAQDSEYAYVESITWDLKDKFKSVELLRLNTLTGQATSVQRPGNVTDWLLDNAGEPRIALTYDKNTSTVYYRDPATSAWRAIASFDRFKGRRDAIEPVGFGADGKLYVSAAAGKDTISLHTFNFSTGKIDPEPVIETPGYDFSGALVNRRGQLLGARLTTDASANVWFDTAMAAVQKKIDALSPGTVNLVTVASSPDAPWVMVTSYSDRHPPSTNVYHLRDGTLKRLFERHPGIDPKHMGRQEPVRYKARDGREIPGLLTIPAAGAGKNLPLVVLVHGGPFVRGNSWGWDPDSQFLASRGYAVLEPEFRGSTGFGHAHFAAGHKQWGRAMQDDLADGARWAIAQGIADPKRICIAGGSYGGYAALMGLANDPGLFRCGVNWAGVTDINLLYNGHWSFDADLTSDYKTYGMPDLIGDPVKDAAQFTATSPVVQAARITQPLLMAYGATDRRVPLHHGKLFLDKVTPHNKQVEWVVYQDEGHGWAQPSTRIDFWGRVERFLG